MREITITLPDAVEINGAKTAPEQYRTIKTEKWDNDFIIAALEHAMSQKIGDPWSNAKNPKREEKVASVHACMEAGDWAQRRATGESSAKFQAKFDAAIAGLNVEALAGKLTREQLFELAKLVKADNAK